MKKNWLSFIRRNLTSMKRKLFNRHKADSILLFSYTEQPLSSKRRFFSRHSHWKLDRKAKVLLTSAVIALVLTSCFAFIALESKPKGDTVLAQSGNSTNPTATPTPHPKSKGSGGIIPSIVGGLTPPIQTTPSPPKPPGIIGSAQALNSTIWSEVAAAAWTYFKPGVGVDSKTGLPYAGGTSFPNFTDWDLGVYIQTVIDAQKIGLINATGNWGSDARIQKVLTFLENRPLNETTHYPFWFYDATTGGDDHTQSDSSTELVDVVDTGVLFDALNNLRLFNNAYAVQVNNIVLNGSANPNGGSNFTALLPAIQDSAQSNSIYAYLFTSGFASFWPKQVGYVPNQILNNIINSPLVSSPYGNLTLPDAPVTCDPLLLSVFNLNNGSKLMNYMNQIYEAHEAYFNATNQFIAFSEGNSLEHGYTYEWVVAPNGSMWQITSQDQKAYYNMDDSVIYTKVAFSFLALYNSTFPREMAISLEDKLPTPTDGGYGDGYTYGGDVVSSVNSNTNGLIIEAALYAIQK